jgi:predicted nucleotidyltransferase component of viral defense system
MNKKLFIETADMLGIDYPALVEKDYYVVNLIKEIKNIKIEGYDLTFTGGTCLSKVYTKTNRFSEDIDFKMSPVGSLKESSKSKKRNIKEKIYENLKQTLNSLSKYKITNKNAGNDYGLQFFEIDYPSEFEKQDFIRPHIKVELFESKTYDLPENHNITSLFNEVSQKNPEIINMPCSTINVIAAEKFVSLLRRTAAEIRGINKDPDVTLIRHAYDLDLILKIGDKEKIRQLVPMIIQNDIEQFGNKDIYFKRDPINEMKTALEHILKDNNYGNRYTTFLNPLVYDPNPPTWEYIKKSLNNIASELLR